jgi:hypothetical protein
VRLKQEIYIRERTKLVLVSHLLCFSRTLCLCCAYYMFAALSHGRKSVLFLPFFSFVFSLSIQHIQQGGNDELFVYCSYTTFLIVFNAHLKNLILCFNEKLMKKNHVKCVFTVLLWMYSQQYVTPVNFSKLY